MNDDLAIQVSNLSKMYKLYNNPVDRVKESLHPFRKRYHREFYSLRNISFQVKRGETIGIIGRNGSGKSTLLKIIAGVLTPTDGSVKVNGKISALLELGSGFNPELTGIENIYFNGALNGFTRSEIDDKLSSIVSFADIGDFVYQRIKTYSSGMLVRLSFASAISIDPDILIIDEALAVGDVFFRQKCYAKMNEFRERGVPIILVSHALPEVEQFCQRTIFLDKGSALFEGNSSEAVKRYYLLDQQARIQPLKVLPASSSIPSGNNNTAMNDSCFTDDHFWPAEEAFYDISNVSQITSDWARCTGIALCNSAGEPCRKFQQGELAIFYSEYELLRDIEVPIGGLVIFNEKGITVHGKSTLEYGSSVPPKVAAGSTIRFRQDIKLEIQAGEYTFESGLATISLDDYHHVSSFLHTDMRSKVNRLCHLPNVGMFAVSYRTEGKPTKLLHHGLCNLQGFCRINVIPSTKTAVPQSRTNVVDRKTLSEQMRQPMIVHITHWKAGSQWMHKILLDCVPPELIISPEIDEVQFLRKPLRESGVYPTVYVTKEQFDRVVQRENWKRFVIIRDLRDTLVSGYFSIKFSHTLNDIRLVRWREQAAKLDVEEGLIYLMDEWLVHSARIQRSWLKSGDPLLRYEDLLHDDLNLLKKVLLDHCQLPVTPEKFEQAVLKNRFDSITHGRKRGTELVTAHERKGIAGDWRNHFTDKVSTYFKACYGDLLIASGYERDLNW